MSRPLSPAPVMMACHGHACVGTLHYYLSGVSSSELRRPLAAIMCIPVPNTSMVSYIGPELLP
jgi:hypothetical protein